MEPCCDYSDASKGAGISRASSRTLRRRGSCGQIALTFAGACCSSAPHGSSDRYSSLPESGGLREPPENTPSTSPCRPNSAGTLAGCSPIVSGKWLPSGLPERKPPPVGYGGTGLSRPIVGSFESGRTTRVRRVPGSPPAPQGQEWSRAVLGKRVFFNDLCDRCSRGSENPCDPSHGATLLIGGEDESFLLCGQPFGSGVSAEGALARVTAKATGSFTSGTKLDDILATAMNATDCFSYHSPVSLPEQREKDHYPLQLRQRAQNRLWLCQGS